MLAAETRVTSASDAGASSMDSLFAWKQIVEPADPFLQAVVSRLADQVQAFDPEIAQYAEYALTGQGKQLRPVLVALAGGAAGPLDDSHVTVAVIIEMVHLATLVHDDVIDEAEIRRGRPTLAVNWGNETAVLLGDCLFAHALKLASGFPTTEICRAVSSATNTVCAGELFQTKRQHNFQFTRTEYFKVLEMKTGELFALSCDLGAFLSGATPVRRAALRHYGMALGTAYQIFDDCVDLFGTESRVGKSLGTDLAKGKLTLPVLLCLERGTPAERAQLEDLIQNWKPAHLAPILALLDKHDTLNGSRDFIRSYLDKARQSLQLLPETSQRAALLGLTVFLAQQTDALTGPA